MCTIMLMDGGKLTYDQLFGEVEEINWRTTKIQCTEGTGQRVQAWQRLSAGRIGVIP